MNKTIITIAAAAVLVAPILFAADEKPMKAPDFTLKNYDGKEVKLADYKGKIVVLEWFNYERSCRQVQRQECRMVSGK